MQKLDQSAMPNVFEEPRADAVASPAFDPKREFSVPWQTGMTGC